MHRNRFRTYKKYPFLLMVGLAQIACDGKVSKGSTLGSTGQLAIATNFADMGLSTALSGNVPDAIKGLGEEAVAPITGTIQVSLPTLKTTERQRSIEGCEIRRSVKNGLNLIREMAQEMCYVEAAAKVFTPNGKYLATYDEDGYRGNYGVWIDDSVAERRRISVCGDGKLRYIFDLEVANRGRAKGVITRINSDADADAADGQTWAVQAKFDSGVTRAGLTRLDIRGDYNSEYGSSRERLFISFEERKVSFVAESKLGESILEEGALEHWSTQSAALVALNLGSVINKYSSSVEGSDEAADAGAYRAYFDGKGFALAAADSDAWKSGGQLFAEAKLLPRLPDWEKIAMPSDAWDCSGTTEVTPEGSKDDYAKCDALVVDWDEENCEDESIFIYSGDSEDITDEQIAATEQVWEQSLNSLALTAELPPSYPFGFGPKN